MKNNKPRYSTRKMSSALSARAFFTQLAFSAVNRRVFLSPSLPLLTPSRSFLLHHCTVDGVECVRWLSPGTKERRGERERGASNQSISANDFRVLYTHTHTHTLRTVTPLDAVVLAFILLLHLLLISLFSQYFVSQDSSRKAHTIDKFPRIKRFYSQHHLTLRSRFL